MKFQIGSFAAYWRAVELFSSGLLSTDLGKYVKELIHAHCTAGLTTPGAPIQCPNITTRTSTSYRV